MKASTKPFKYYARGKGTYLLATLGRQEQDRGKEGRIRENEYGAAKILSIYFSKWYVRREKDKNKGYGGGARGGGLLNSLFRLFLSFF